MAPATMAAAGERFSLVDTESAREFMRETLAKVRAEELAAIAGECATKHARLAARLAPGRRRTLGADDLRAVFRAIFSTRRRADLLLGRFGAPALAAWIDDLLGGPDPVERRLEAFHDRLVGVDDALRYDLPSELLHWTEPERAWLWTRWIWDPNTRTGALPLVTMEAVELTGPTVADTYRRVGEATAFVGAVGRAAGFAPIGEDPFGVDVYLACVYCVYVYTTVRLRMTQEFNRVIPPLPELTRRFLGVHRLEV